MKWVRNVLLTALMCAASASLMAEVQPAKVDLSKDKTLYVVSTAHLDTQWLWTIQDTIDQYVPNTLRGQFALFDKYPDYVFSFEGAFRYMLMKEYYPEEYERLKGYIRDGRWRVAGTSIDAGDSNIPSPESIIRHALYGQMYFRDEFGKSSADFMLPDSFGFGYTLPTIAAHCGVKGFSTQKLTWGCFVGAPFAVGNWEGVDGSSILAALRAGDYTARLRSDQSTDDGWVKAVEDQGRDSGVFAAYRYFGVGDRGGAPDDQSVEWLERSLANGGGSVRALSAGSDQFFRDITPEQAKRLPRYNGELLMTTHGTGCYTSQAAMKRWNRKNELLADAAERAAVTADWLGGATYPTQTLHEAWVRFLWHQFHDDLTGTSIPQAYVFSWNDEAIAQNQFAQVLGSSAGAVARALDTRAEGIPVVVYNALSIARSDVVSAKAQLPSEGVSVRVFGPDGEETPSQIVSRDGAQVEVAFLAHVPSDGFAVYDLRPSASGCALKTGLFVDGQTVENADYRVRIDANGDVCSVYDKSVGREMLSSPIRLQVYDDKPRSYPAWEVWYRDISGDPVEYVSGPATVRVVERGPVRVTLEVTRRARKSTFAQRITLTAGGSGDRVEFDTSVDWRSKATIVKAAFPLSVSNPKAVYDLGIGTVARGNNTDKLYEVPAQQWADLTGADGAYGVEVMNDSKYGWDKPGDNTLRLTLLRTPQASDYQKENDFGRHRFVYAISGHKGDWRQGQAAWRAARLNQPLRAFVAPSHAGPLGRSFSMLRVSSPEVAVKALKKAERSDEIVVRVQETTGSPVNGVKLALAAPIVSAREVNGVEDSIGAASVQDGMLRFDLRGYQPRAFALKLAAPASRLSTPASASVDLPYNLEMTSAQGEKKSGGFDGDGRFIPSELFPKTVTSAGIEFKMGPSGGANGVSCQGQTIGLAPGQHRELYLLAASTGGDRRALFTVGSRKVGLNVQSCTGNIGQWDSRVVGGRQVSASEAQRAFLKTAPVAWVGTHRHDGEGRDESYLFCYLFRYRIAIPDGADSIALPNDPRIRVAAMSLASNPNDDTTPAESIVDIPADARLRIAAPAEEKPLDARNLAKTAPGLRYQVYTNQRDHFLPDFGKLTPSSEGVASSFAQVGTNAPEYTAYRIGGYIEIPADGKYTFDLSSDDGSKLYIDGQEVIDKDGDFEGYMSAGNINLRAGKHAIELLYFNRKGGSMIDLRYAGPGIAEQPIPESVLSHEE